MSARPARVVDIAVRAFPRPMPRKGERHNPGQPSGIVVVFDTETRVDVSQRLLFGSYRVYGPTGRLVEEGLIAADDLTNAERLTLEEYGQSVRPLRLRHLTRQQFVDRILWDVVYRARATLVGFNLFYDLSRLALGWRPARGALFDGGISLRFWPEWTGPDGRRHPHQYRPEIRIRTLDSKRPFIQFSRPARIDPSNLGENGKPFPGHFVDLRATSYAFSDRSHSLESACRAFGVDRPKEAYSGKHGVLTADYINYNREDVRTTYELYHKLAAEHAKHPIRLPLTQTMSPAAIAKAYLREMGIRPAMEKNPRFSFQRLGQAMAAYFGGRAEARNRLQELPVVYTDVSSMYATVFALGDLWRFVVAGRLEVRKATRECGRFLRTLTREALLEPEIWPRLAMTFCRIRPSGQLLPVRASYAQNGWQIGLNHLDSAPTDLWYTLADLAASVILGGPLPDIAEAFRIVPVGVQRGLASIRFRSAITIDPNQSDFFIRLVEERHRVLNDSRLPEDERRALASALKTIANAAAYGIWAEMRDEPTVAGGVQADVAGIREFSTRVGRPERAGEYCFSPLAATVTGLARLLLALLQAEVEARGGTYLACDTDSLIIVASRHGGPVRSSVGTAIHTLSWAEVDDIRDRLNRLNPYDRQLVPDLVKLEDENFALTNDGTVDRTSRSDLYGLAISAKRFALYELLENGRVRLRKRSAHGLGALLSPITAGDQIWIDEVWQRIIARARGVPESPEPEWYQLPALSRVSATSVGVLRAFAGFNSGRDYANQVKPANFLLLAHDDPLVALPEGMDRNRLTLIAPFSSAPDEWLTLAYRNRFDGQPIAVTTRSGGSAGAVRVKNFGDLVDRYANHPEAKSAAADGSPCTRSTAGLLTRLHIDATRVRHIGKESNHLEEVEAGELRTTEDPVREYADPRGEWELARPRLHALQRLVGRARMREASGLSERALRDAISGRRLPHRRTREALLALLGDGSGNT